MMELTKTKINPRILAILLLSFSSGLPLALTGSTLQAWFTEAHINLMTIGILSLVGLPYVWKFLWSPLMDRFVPPLFGRRRGWIFITQIGLCILLFILANMNPEKTPLTMGCIAFLIAFLSATQDIAIDAYRVDILFSEERGLGAACTIFAARMAMLVSGGLSLILAQHIGWRFTYELMAILMAIGILVTYFAPETSAVKPPATLVASLVLPFQDLLNREGVGLILLFVVLYKIGDALALSLMSNFLLHGLDFSLTDVAIAFKTVGLAATILGAFAGGIALRKLNIYQALMWFGLAQAFSNLMFMLLAYVGKNYVIMSSSLFIESFCSGLSTAALLAYLMSLCHPQYSATQYAVLSALFAIGRVFLGPLAAMLVTHYGWIFFYFCSFIACFPGIILINLIKKRVVGNAEVVGI